MRVYITVRRSLDELYISMSIVGSFLSQLYHFVAFRLEKPKMRLEMGMFIISIDVDVGSKELGVINRGRNDRNVNRNISEYRVGEIEEAALPLFVETFNDFEIPVTFAIRGQLTELKDSILELLLESSVKHDIGAHGYYHRKFTDLSRNEAENELKMILRGMKRFGIIPRTFVFPVNSVDHLNLLEKYGYKCYRGCGGLMNDCMYIEKCGELYNIHPSIYIDQHTKFSFLKKFLDVSTKKRLPFHVWFHLWNFAQDEGHLQRSIDNIFVRLFNYAKRKEKSGILTFETMFSSAEKVEKVTGL